MIYTSANTGAPNSILTSLVYLANGGLAAIGLGPDDGDVTISNFLSSEANMYVADSFVSTYYVGGISTTTTQTIDSPNATFYLAANPTIIESSIDVTAANQFVFQINNNGCPFINTVLVVGVQDSGINEADQGTFQLAMYASAGGFELENTYANQLNGGPVHNLTVTGITGVGMGVITSFEITFTGAFTVTPANLLIYAANAVEGADSHTVSNVSTSL